MKNVLLAVILAAVLNGCTALDPAAFQGEKHYPVLSTYLDKMKNPQQTVEARISGDLSQLEAAYDTRDIVDAFSTRFLTGFSNSAPIKVTFGKSVTGNAAYRQADFPPSYHRLGMAFNAPAGYGVHFGTDQTEVVRLINDLNTDGGIILYHHLTVLPKQMEAHVVSVAIAYDKEGRKVLQDSSSYVYSVENYLREAAIDLQATKRAAVDHAEAAGRAFGEFLRAKLNYG